MKWFLYDIIKVYPYPSIYNLSLLFHNLRSKSVSIELSFYYAFFIKNLVFFERETLYFGKAVKILAVINVLFNLDRMYIIKQVDNKWREF